MKNNMHKVSLFFMSLMVCTTVWGMKRPSSDLITRSQWKKKLEQSRDAKIASENDMIGELVSLPEPLTQPMNSASAPKNKKQLQCSECIFSAVNQSYLTVHQRLHDDEQNGKVVYSCDQCGYRTLRSIVLNEHLYTHQDIKRFACTLNGCDSLFATKRSRVRHVKMLHNI